MFEIGIMLQFLVLCYSYLGDGMDNAAAVLLDINDGPSPFQISGLAGKVANMLATCCPDSQMSAHLADMPLSW
jgi:hypothetical protein